MAAEAGSETRQGAASDEESDGCDGAQDCNTTNEAERLYNSLPAPNYQYSFSYKIIYA
jgi:hypothetical protein